MLQSSFSVCKEGLGMEARLAECCPTQKPSIAAGQYPAVTLSLLAACKRIMTISRDCVKAIGNWEAAVKRLGRLCKTCWTCTNSGDDVERDGV